MNILVTGATGYIGGRLIPRLLQAGHHVRCLIRKHGALSGRSWNSTNHAVDFFCGDVLQPDSLEGVCADIDVAYYLIHSMAAGEMGFGDRDRIAATNFASAAKRAGVKKIIYLGGLGDEKNTDEGLSHHLKSRQEVGSILRDSGVPTIEFRAAIIVGSGSISFEMIRYLTERLPIMICPKWVMSRCQPISIRDVLSYLVAAAELPNETHQMFEIGGKDVLTYRDMMLRYAKIRGLKRWLVRVPFLTPRLSSYWVDLVTPIPAAIARPLIEGLKNDVICTSTLARNVFAFEPMGYDAAVTLAFDRTQQGNLETIWSGTESSLGSASSSQTEMREGMILDTRQIAISASKEKIFQVICSLGGKTGWLYANWAWHLRGLIDRLLGGVGMRRGRRDKNVLQIGDALDFWRVEEVLPNKTLRLRAEMKVPGKAWLQFQIDNHQLTQTAFFEPSGLAGLIYWYALYPIHQYIFAGMLKKIKSKCET